MYKIDTNRTHTGAISSTNPILIREADSGIWAFIVVSDRSTAIGADNAGTMKERAERLVLLMNMFSTVPTSQLKELQNKLDNFRAKG